MYYKVFFVYNWLYIYIYVYTHTHTHIYIIYIYIYTYINIYTHILAERRSGLPAAGLLRRVDLRRSQTFPNPFPTANFQTKNL